MTIPGLFGKLPSKGDFIARGLEPSVLGPFEAWLAATMEAARLALGDDFKPIYDAAPVWQFWIGPGAGLAPCAGAIAPSVDRVGRRYPLAILWPGAPDGTGLPPPPTVNGAAEWFAAVQTALARAMQRDLAGDPAEVLRDLPVPDPEYVPPPPDQGGDPRRIAWKVGPMPTAPQASVGASPVEPAQATAPQSASVSVPALLAHPMPEANLWLAPSDAIDDASPFGSDGQSDSPFGSGPLDASPFDLPGEKPPPAWPFAKAATGNMAAATRPPSSIFMAPPDPEPHLATAAGASAQKAAKPWEERTVPPLSDNASAEPTGAAEAVAATPAETEPSAIGDKAEIADAPTAVAPDVETQPAPDASPPSEAGKAVASEHTLPPIGPVVDPDPAQPADAKPPADEKTIPPFSSSPGNADWPPASAFGPMPDPDPMPAAAAKPSAEFLTGAALCDAAVMALGRSFWWTKGDAYTPEAYFALDGLPDGQIFAAMLGGFRMAALAKVQE